MLLKIMMRRLLEIAIQTEALDFANLEKEEPCRVRRYHSGGKNAREHFRPADIPRSSPSRASGLFQIFEIGNTTAHRSRRTGQVKKLSSGMAETGGGTLDFEDAAMEFIYWGV